MAGGLLPQHKTSSDGRARSCWPERVSSGAHTSCAHKGKEHECLALQFNGSYFRPTNCANVKCHHFQYQDDHRLAFHDLPWSSPDRWRFFVPQSSSDPWCIAPASDSDSGASAKVWFPRGLKAKRTAKGPLGKQTRDTRHKHI